MKIQVLAALLCLPLCSAWAVSEGLEDGSNNVSGGAVNFTLPDTLTGTLGTDGASPPTDYFKWNATSGVTYSFSATSSGLPQLNLALDVENGVGSVLQSANANGAGGPENLSFLAPSTATYYLVVWRADATATGASYSISAQVTASVDDWSLY